MFVRHLVTALLVLPLLSTVLAPGEASACTPPYGFTVDRSFPAADAVDVPIDGVIVVLGEGYGGPVVQVEVFLSDTPVPGEIESVTSNRYVWRSDAPLAADTQYQVIITTQDEIDQPHVRELQFTTGADPAGAVPVPELASAAAEGFEQEVKECVEPGGGGDCVDCYDFKVVGSEQRLRLIAELKAPGGTFAGYHIGRVAYGESADMQSMELQADEPEAGNIVFVQDLGLAGEWPSDEVCVRPELEDPLGNLESGEVQCVDISDINVPPVDEPTTGDSESAGSDSEGSEGSDSGPSGDGEKGCGCRGDADAGWSGLLALIGLVGLRRRRVRA